MINPGLVQLLQTVGRLPHSRGGHTEPQLRVASFGKPSLILSQTYAESLAIHQYKVLRNEREDGFLASINKQFSSQFQSYDPQRLLSNCFGRSVAIDIIDADPEKLASLCWDLNYPIPTRWHNQFDLVLDSGTHEHVFNIGTSLLSAASLPTQQGLIVGALPLYSPNHGFYNINPTCIAELFSPTNGYVLLELKVQSYDSPWHSLKGTANYSIDLCKLREKITNQDDFLLAIQANQIEPSKLSSFNTLYYAARRTSLLPITPPQQRKYKG